MAKAEVSTTQFSVGRVLGLWVLGFGGFGFGGSRGWFLGFEALDLGSRFQDTV